MPLSCQGVIVVLSASTRAAACFRGHRGSASSGEGRTPALLAKGYRQIPVLSLCQNHSEGKPHRYPKNTLTHAVHSGVK